MWLISSLVELLEKRKVQVNKKKTDEKSTSSNRTLVLLWWIFAFTLLMKTHCRKCELSFLHASYIKLSIWLNRSWTSKQNLTLQKSRLVCFKSIKLCSYHNRYTNEIQTAQGCGELFINSKICASIKYIFPYWASRLQ